VLALPQAAKRVPWYTIVNDFEKRGAEGSRDLPIDSKPQEILCSDYTNRRQAAWASVLRPDLRRSPPLPAQPVASPHLQDRKVARGRIRP
jgi:hypothetical protein